MISVYDVGGIFVDEQDLEKRKIDFLSQWEVKYLEDISEIQEKPIKITSKFSCNSGKFYICKTEIQIKEVIDILFKEASLKSKKFFDFCKNNVVYDGYIYAVTDFLLKECEENPDNYAYKYSYINSFNFPSDGIFIEKIEDKNNEYSEMDSLSSKF